MRYSGTNMTSSVSQVASGAAAAGSGPAAGGAVSDIILAVTERQITPDETACFPFAARTAYGVPSVHDFTVTSDNPRFNPVWARVCPSAGDSYGPRFTLEISPGVIGRTQYGVYPLRVSWRAAGAYRQAAGQCTLVIRPQVRVVAEPVVEVWPAGQIWLLLENRESTGIDVALSIRQDGSDWAQEWEFGLPAKDGPSSFSRSFVPPDGKRHGDYELAVDAAGLPVLRRTIRVRRSLLTRRYTTGLQVSA